MSKKEYIQQYLYDYVLRGQCMDIEGHLFREAFMCGWPTIYNTPEQAFLSSMIGSAWGAWTVMRRPDKDIYTICRHQESDKQFYVDPDREWMFNKMPDGSLELKDSLKNPTHDSQEQSSEQSQPR